MTYWPRSALLGTMCVLAMFGCSRLEPLTISSVPRDPEVVKHGSDLVHGVAACGFCHGETADPGSILAGGQAFQDRYGEVRAGNLTPSRTGLGTWRDAEVMRAIRAAVGPEDQWLSQESHSGYEWMSDNDAYSIVSYLRTIPPVEKSVPRRSLSFVDRNTTGFFESRYEVRGYVPDVPPAASTEYGQYLTEHVARCGSCHNGPGTFLTAEEYLAGGKTITNERGSKVAPGISGSRVYGIGEWDEDAVVKYLKTGMTPDGSVSDAEFCPWQFYARGSDQELHAIAKYLKSLNVP